MKFYKHNVQKGILQHNLILNKITAVYTNNFFTIFYVNGVPHNIENAAMVSKQRSIFYLNGMRIGTKEDFSKDTWKKFAKNINFINFK